MFRGKAYKCPAGKPTIGYGTTKYPNGLHVAIGDMIVTREYAENLLMDHINKEVRPYIKKYVLTPLNSNQRGALESFIYNLGSDAFRKSTLRKKINAGDFYGAAREIGRFYYADGKMLKGLVNRRMDEMVLFLTPSYVNDNQVDEVEYKKPTFFERLINFFKKGD